MSIRTSEVSQVPGLLQHFNRDLPASIVVFFVALPLCLGIALASGAPLFSGIIAGIIGGVVVGLASSSQLGVSGPAAGLAVIVLTAITQLGSYQVFLAAVVLAGLFQILLGQIKAGFIAYFVPTSVIKGMLTGIGLLIILKQIPHAFGYDADFEGDEAFEELGGHNTFTDILQTWDLLTPGAVLIALVSFFILILWDHVLVKKHKIFQLLQGPIVVVLAGILLNCAFMHDWLGFKLRDSQIVQLPVARSLSDFVSFLTYPDFSQIFQPVVIKTAIVMAIVASLETLLCVEATDKLDPAKRVTPTNRELKAQGLGNMISGLLGGLPITQVIVRSSANITFGAQTKASAILHGCWLLLSAMTIASFLNLIPLASLAAILIMVGYKLAKPGLFKQMYDLGWEQFIPFIITVVAIVLTDLLTGIALGLVMAVFFTLHHSYRNSHYLKKTQSIEDDRKVYHLILAEEVSFFNKASILQELDTIPAGSKVVIDCAQCKSIAYDVIECIHDFQLHAKLKNIEVQTVDFKPPKHMLGQ